ncbi:acetyltransferase [Flavobacterium sp. TSSA_36]|uniref:acetyltransferase n=1 Tax=Flavobacterium sp. TSSA_36 TaxID=3447669 RepID=UPI003F2C927A
MYIIGAGGHGKVVAEVAELLGERIYSFVDANEALTSLWVYPVTPTFPENSNRVVIAIGDNLVRKAISSAFDAQYICLFHPFTQISTRSTIGEGTVVIGGAVINANASIGRHVIVNTNSSVGHDACLEDFVHIAPNVALAGHVHIGEGTFVGMGASVLPGVQIGKWCVIGAGAVVLENVPDGAKVVGNPAKVLCNEVANDCSR